MVNLKKFATTFLSGLLCVAMVGCSNNSKENKDADVRAEFEKVLEAYRGMTFEEWVEEFEISDASILSDETKKLYGKYFKAIKTEGCRTYEIKRDESNKATDDRVLKDIHTETIVYSDGTFKVKKVFAPGDGFQYTDENGEKSKSEFTTSFISLSYDDLNIDHLENITLTTDNGKKIFKFNYKLAPMFGRLYGYGKYLKQDSSIELVNLSGSLSFEEASNKAQHSINIEYVDKTTGEVAKGTFVGNFSNVNQELPFPKDLDTYKMAE